MKPFPWTDVIGFGLGVLRLPPSQFWAMTPRELALAIRAVRGPVQMPMGRSLLNELMTRFPDRMEGA